MTLSLLIELGIRNWHRSLPQQIGDIRRTVSLQPSHTRERLLTSHKCGGPQSLRRESSRRRLQLQNLRQLCIR